jgi:hypothetical protein
VKCAHSSTLVKGIFSTKLGIPAMACHMTLLSPLLPDVLLTPFINHTYHCNNECCPVLFFIHDVSFITNHPCRYSIFYQVVTVLMCLTYIFKLYRSLIQSTGNFNGFCQSFQVNMKLACRKWHQSLPSFLNL